MSSTITPYSTTKALRLNPGWIPQLVTGARRLLGRRDLNAISTSQEEQVRQLIQSISRLKNKHSLSLEDAKILKQIKKIFGYSGKYPMYLDKEKIIEDILSTDELNKLETEKRDQILDALERDFRASLFASTYEPRVLRTEIDGVSKTYQAFNDVFDAKPNYSARDLEEIIGKINNLGVFDLETIKESGLVRTSNTINQEMRWQWITDSSAVGDLQKSRDPKSWRKSMITNAAVYNTNEAKRRIKDVIDNPADLRAVNEERDVALNRGLFHIFRPNTIKFEADGTPILSSIEAGTWANPKRQESQALLLRDLIQTVKNHDKAWGFKTDEEFQAKKKEFVFNTIANLSKYLLAANYNTKTQSYDHKAPSNSSWEEVTFWQGVTWDTALVTLAFSELKDILFNEKYSNDSLVQELRASLRQSLESNTPAYANFDDKGKLQEFINSGRKIVNEATATQLSQDQLPYQVKERKADTSLVLLAASDYKFNHQNPVADAAIRLRLVQTMKQELMGDHGMRRFNEFIRRDYNTNEPVKVHDNYLSANYATAMDATPLAVLKTGHDSPKLTRFSSDSGSAGDLVRRQQFSKPEYAAQWTIGPTAAIKALVICKQSLIRHLKDNRGDEQALTLLKKVNNELTDSINSSLAHIAGGKWGKNENLVRADGSYLPQDYAVMEAYQVITDLHGRPKWVPGAHTLAWSTALLLYGLSATHAIEKQAQDLKL